MKTRTVLVSAVALTVLLASPALAGKMQRRNRVDRYKHYNTCATCPRTVIDYGPDGKLNHRYWAAQAVNGAFWNHEPLYYVWESGSVYYSGGRCTSKVRWNAGAEHYGQLWNRWREVQADRYHVDGSGPYGGSGHPAYRYRRTIFHWTIDAAGWNIADRHKYVGMTLRCDGTWQPAG